jgi:hypothetical protein
MKTDEALEDLDIHWLMYENSTEFYQYMNYVEVEKIGF